MKRTMLPKLPQTVSFRLPDAYMKALVVRAERSRVSPGEYAREALTDHLEDAARERLESEMRALQTEVAFLRADFATAVEALLVLAGAGSVTPIEAQTWVEERLRQAGQTKADEEED